VRKRVVRSFIYSLVPHNLFIATHWFLASVQKLDFEISFSRVQISRCNTVVRNTTILPDSFRVQISPEMAESMAYIRQRVDITIRDLELITDRRTVFRLLRRGMERQKIIEIMKPRSESWVDKWIARYKENDENFFTKHRSGRPHKMTTSKGVCACTREAVGVCVRVCVCVYSLLSFFEMRNRTLHPQCIKKHFI